MLDIVEFVDPVGTEIVQRVPSRGSGEFRIGSQCVVREGQVAIFARDGKTADVFGPGRHTLVTANLPLLGRLVGAPFGGRSPFRAEVYFFSTRLFTDLRWGTSQPILVRDPRLGPVRLRAFGVYAMRVDDPTLVASKIIAGRSLYSTADIEGYLRAMIMQGMADLLAEFMLHEQLSVLDLSAQYNELSGIATETLGAGFANLGLYLQTLLISAIALPDEVEQRLDAATGVSLFGGIDGYTRYKVAEAIGNAGGGAASAVVGLGVGASLGGLLDQQLRPVLSQAAAAAQCASCRAALQPSARFCSACGSNQQPIAQQCTHCSAVLATGARFCSDCGTPA